MLLAGAYCHVVLPASSGKSVRRLREALLPSLRASDSTCNFIKEE